VQGASEVRPVFFIGTPSDALTLASRAHPGDVILFRSTHTISDNAIWRYQSLYSPKYYSQQACEYVHAALYIRNTTIMHAIPSTKGATLSGVQYDDLAVYGLRNEVCLLRVPGLSQQTESEILAKAHLRQGDTYDYVGIGRAVWQSIVNKMKFNPGGGDPRYRVFSADADYYRRMHCSGFIRRVYLDAVGAKGNPLIAGRTPAPLYTPADLFENTNLQSISVP